MQLIRSKIRLNNSHSDIFQRAELAEASLAEVNADRDALALALEAFREEAEKVCDEQKKSNELEMERHFYELLQQAVGGRNASSDCARKIRALPITSLERGDELLRDARRYGELRKNHTTSLIIMFFGNGCINRTIEEVEAVLDIDAMRGQK